MNEAKKQQLLDMAAMLIPSADRMDAITEEMSRHGRCDEQLAPIWAEKLRYSYAKVQETKYPEYAASNGDVLPIDSSPDPAATTWEYFMVDSIGFADWIDDDGRLAPNGAMTAKRYTGEMHEMGHKWDVSVFDLERAAKAGLQISTAKQKAARKAHEALTNWVWLFGDSEKGLPGLCNHPNITVTNAAAAAGGGNGIPWTDGDKTVDEVLDDVTTLVDTIATNTLGAYHAATVFMSREFYHYLRNTRLGAGDGFSSLLELVQSRYEGDASGQGRVEFKILNECAAANRLHPKSGSDDSGISGTFMLAVPSADADELSFIRARPYTQRPPQERDLVMHHMTHSKIGGCKMQIPLAVHRLDFGT